mmetsp:Transcript_13710/g.16349  ORF Transcript_13710/g.16349 Transcript_13710/m.16349 type:complete len:84 (+) Transcript_13710:517-768(+)
MNCCRSMSSQIQACCNFSHPVKRRHFSDPKVRRNDSAAVQVYQGQLYCNPCGREIDEYSFYYTCEEMCDYDICSDCLNCPNGK